MSKKNTILDPAFSTRILFLQFSSSRESLRRACNNSTIILRRVIWRWNFLA